MAATRAGHRSPRRRLWWWVAGVATALVLAVVVAGSLLMPYPVINDISTDLEQPPGYLTSPPADDHFDTERLAGPIRKAYGDLSNLATPHPPDDVFLVVQALVAQRQWRVAAVDLSHRTIQAVVTTALLRFKDDVVITVRETPAGSEVAMRSKSRVGKGDLGANAKRIRAFLADLDAGL